MKIHTFGSLILLSAFVHGEDFVIIDDQFDDGDPQTNDSGGYSARGYASMDREEIDNAIKFGPVSNWEWPGLELRTNTEFAPPAEGDSYTVEWVIGPMTVEAHNDTPEDPTPEWGDLRQELTIAPAVLSQGSDIVELWPTVGNGIIAGQLTLKEADPSAPAQLANLGVYVKDMDSTAASNGVWIAGTNDIDVSTPTKITYIIDQTSIRVLVDDTEVGNRFLSEPDAGYDLGFGEGEEFESGFFVSTRTAMVKATTGTMSLENFTVTKTSESSPLAWPGGDTYETDLSFLGSFWELEGWTQTAVTQTAASINRNTTTENPWAGGGAIGSSNRSATDPAFWFDPDTNTVLSEAQAPEDAPFDAPLTPLVVPTDVTTLSDKVSGQWLQSLGSEAHLGAMTLRFEELPIHNGIDLDFILAAFDSFDGGDWFGNTGGPQDPDPNGNGYNFRIKVDGEVIYEQRFYTGGKMDGGTLFGVEDLGTDLNYSSNYAEYWGPDNSGLEPADVNDRHFLPWTTDSLYDFSNYFNEDGENSIAHTGSTLEITFEHGLDAGYTEGYTDEGFAIDGVTLRLLGVPEDPNARVQITSFTVTDSGNQINWSDSIGTSFKIERSTDLETWLEISDGETGSGYLDTTAPADTPVFYRVLREQ